MKYKDTVHFCNLTHRGVNYVIKIQEMIEILLPIQTFIFITKYQQFYEFNDIDMKGKFSVPH